MIKAPHFVFRVRVFLCFYKGLLACIRIVLRHLSSSLNYSVLLSMLTALRLKSLERFVIRWVSVEDCLAGEGLC
jgi:hypothetical protein